MSASIPAPRLGVIGLGTMGRNLALNLADRGHRVAAWNLEPEAALALAAVRPQAFLATDTVEALVTALPRPRIVLVMVTAGRPVDAVLTRLSPLLGPGDVVLDGGNSHPEDTARREADLARAGIVLMGTGVSGGAEGARHGPSLMPGGSPAGWELVRPVLESIAARSEDGPCVAHVGLGAAGHFVKMVHNGIEYADMQLLAEAYDCLRRLLRLPAPRMAEVFAAWNEGPLASFLVELTARIFTVYDEATRAPLLDLVLDRAGQKGTGKWTVQAALDLGVAVPTIAAALDARIVSSARDERVEAAGSLSGPAQVPWDGDAGAFIADLEQAVLVSRVCALDQGFRLARTASDHHEWGVQLPELARIWKAGCIIRSRLLDPVRASLLAQPDRPSLLLSEHLGRMADTAQASWRRVVAAATASGVPVPALSASLAWYDSYRCASLPTNLIQAQRDAFGAHGFERADRPDDGLQHARWQ